MMQERKIICKILVGSHLYGTNHEDSDTDYLGVFLPSTEDLLGLRNCPKEMTENVKISSGTKNAKGDIDCKYTSLQRFLKLAMEGQSKELEMLFAPQSNIMMAEPEWLQIVHNRQLLLSKGSIKPIVGFAIAQMHKSVIKGENLNKIRALILELDKWPISKLKEPLSAYIHIAIKDQCALLCGISLTYQVNEFGHPLLRIGGRDYDVNSMAKHFLNGLKELEGRYGSRSETAAQEGVDVKGLMHAYRLLFEANELLQTGHITLPLSKQHVDFLTKIRLRDPQTMQVDHFAELNRLIEHLDNEIVPASQLPTHPRHKQINDLCQNILSCHLFGVKNG
jgi:predicted nucleotidyltransferase